jgi:hypothetical protein
MRVQKERDIPHPIQNTKMALWGKEPNSNDNGQQ